MKQIIKITTPLLLLAVFLFSSCKKGDEGPAGKDGNANVIGSNEFTISSSYWVSEQGGSTGTVYYVEVTWDKITETIANKGAVLCYYKQTDHTWAPLPYIDYSYIFAPGGMAIIYDNNSNPGMQTFRIVTIASSELSKHPDVDLNNYEEVNKAFTKGD